jgi:hypothetical protein
LAASFFHWSKIVAELFQLDLDKLADGGGPRWLIRLLTPPLIDSLQELGRNPHFKPLGFFCHNPLTPMYVHFT